jgi:hypothetical protein
MIIKGSSRAGPRQLVRHLLRTDTNERVEILQLDDPSRDLKFALKGWQNLSELTNGTKGLYHANIDPDARYSMTSEQWMRSVDVLEEELGLKGQPRAVVLHEKEGREHIHVVWQRTDFEREIMISDSHNYAAHERASSRLEDEFGHERVQGAHSKRDKTKQRPREAFNHAAWQQAERTGQNPRDRKEIITDLYQQTGTAEDPSKAFREGLESADFLLARGDKRGFVIVDLTGEVHALARQIEGVRTKDLKERLADVNLEALPSVEDAKIIQREKAQKRAAEQEREASRRQQVTVIDIDPASDFFLSEPTPETIPEQALEQAVPTEPVSAEEPATRQPLTEAFERAAHPDGKAPSEPNIRSDFNQASAAAEGEKREAALPAAHKRRLRERIEQHEALAADLERRQQEKRLALKADQDQNLADSLGVSVQDLAACLMAMEGSRFAPSELLYAERARTPQERTLRRAFLAETRKVYAEELKALEEAQEKERQWLEEQQSQDINRLHADFEREAKLYEEQERLRLEREEAREREISRDDPGHTRR